MALYTIKKSDLNKTRIQDRELPSILRRNPGVPLRPGAVINLPANRNSSGVVPGLPSGTQGASGVSNTGQGIPNAPKNSWTTNSPTNVPEGIDATAPGALPASYYLANQNSIPNFNNTSVLTSSLTPMTPAQRVQSEYGIQQPATDPQANAWAQRAQAAGLNGNQVAGSVVSNPSVSNPNASRFENPINPNITYNRPTGNWKTENAGYPMPPVDDVLRNPALAAEWRASVDSGLAETASEKWERMKSQYSTLGELYENFTPQELRWFQRFASPTDMQYWNLINQIRAKANKGGGANGPSTGGSGDSGSGYGTPRSYASNYGSSYGLINWRL